MLLLAQVLAATDPLAAGPVLGRYDALTRADRTGEVFSDDPRLEGLEQHVRGLVTRARGDAAGARASLRRAFATFRAAASCGAPRSR